MKVAAEGQRLSPTLGSPRMLDPARASTPQCGSCPACGLVVRRRALASTTRLILGLLLVGLAKQMTGSGSSDSTRMSTDDWEIRRVGQPVADRRRRGRWRSMAASSGSGWLGASSSSMWRS